jgi:hypothetical protein
VSTKKNAGRRFASIKNKRADHMKPGQGENDLIHEGKPK